MKSFLEKTAKIVSWKPSARLVSVFAFLMLVIILVPLARIIPYTVPWYDDYNYGSYARNGIELYGGICGAVKGAADCVRTQWYAWQGTYSSIFFMALMPAVWGEDKYFLGSLFIFALLILGVFALVKVLVRDVLGGNRYSCLTLQSVTASVVLMFIYTAKTGFYWYNAGIHYVGMHAVAMLLIAAAIKLLTAKKKQTVWLFLPFSMLFAFVAALSFCLYTSGFTPSLYAMGHGGLSRTLNAVKMTWQLLLILNEVYFLGWLQQYLEKKSKNISGDASWWFYALVGVVMLLIFSASDNQAGNYSAYGAYYYVHTGEAYNFHEQYLERVEMLKSDASQVVLEPYRFKPWFLCMGDLSDNPDSEENRAIADWYGKASVVVPDPDKQE